MPYGHYPLLYGADKDQNQDCYCWPLRWRNFPDYLYLTDWLKEDRKEYVQLQERYLSMQKEYGQDREFARFCKDESKFWLRMQRACTLMLGYCGEAEYRSSTSWPKELVTELDLETAHLEFKEYADHTGNASGDA